MWSDMLASSCSGQVEDQILSVYFCPDQPLAKNTSLQKQRHEHIQNQGQGTGAFQGGSSKDEVTLPTLYNKVTSVGCIYLLIWQTFIWCKIKRNLRSSLTWFADDLLILQPRPSDRATHPISSQFSHRGKNNHWNVTWHHLLPSIFGHSACSWNRLTIIPQRNCPKPKHHYEKISHGDNLTLNTGGKRKKEEKKRKSTKEWGNCSEPLTRSHK